MKQSEYIFVYGTLKRGHHNHRRILSDAKFLGRAHSVEKNFRLYADGIPFLIEAAQGWGGNQIIGELYEVSPATLGRCDRLEGHPLMYCREKHLFDLDSAPSPATFEAWVYIYQHPERFADNLRDWVKPNTEGAVEW